MAKSGRVSLTNSFKMPSSSPTPYVVIPENMFRLAQLFGLYPYQRPTAETLQKTGRSGSMKVHRWLALWTSILCVVLLALAVNWITGYVLIYSEQLVELQFFVLISFIFKGFLVLQGPVLQIITIIKMRNLPILLKEMVDDLWLDATAHKKQMILLTIWSCISATLGITSFWQAFVPIMEQFNDVFKGWVRFCLKDPNLVVPEYTSLLINAVCLFFGLCHQTIPLWCLMVLLTTLRSGYAKIRANLAELVDCSQSEKGVTKTVNEIRLARQAYRLLQCHAVAIDRMFSWHILVVCICEFLGLIAACSTWLQPPGQEVFLGQKIDTAAIDTSTQLLVYYFGIGGFVNLLVKVFVAISTHEKAQLVRAELRRLMARIPVREIQEECGLFIAECEPLDGAISAGGFFYITKEFVTTLTETTVTYALVIYQTRDTKQDISEVAHKHQLEEVSRRLNDVWELLHTYNNVNVGITEEIFETGNETLRT